MAYSMLFNTGVRMENHLDKKGNLIRMDYEVWVNGQLHKEYFLETEPPANSRLDWLQPKETLDLLPCQIAIPIVGGGMCADFAVFTIFEEPKIEQGEQP